MISFLSSSFRYRCAAPAIPATAASDCIMKFKYHKASLFSVGIFSQSCCCAGKFFFNFFLMLLGLIPRPRSRFIACAAFLNNERSSELFIVANNWPSNSLYSPSGIFPSPPHLGHGDAVQFSKVIFRAFTTLKPDWNNVRQSLFVHIAGISDICFYKPNVC